MCELVSKIFKNLPVKAFDIVEVSPNGLLKKVYNTIDDIIDKSGAWYAYNGDKIGQGRENAKQYLAENPAVMDEIEAKVREHYNLVQGKEV